MWPHLILNLVLLSTIATSADVPPQSPPSNSSHAKSIIDEPKCGDVRALCPNLSENDDIPILECLQSIPAGDLRLDEACQSAVWAHMAQLTASAPVRARLLPLCRADLERLACDASRPDFLKCVVGGREALQSADCGRLVARLEGVAFRDYRFVASFLQACAADVRRLDCGRVDARAPTQRQTVACLQANVQAVAAACRAEVLALSALQAEDMRLDAPLQQACAADARRLCAQAPPGGAVACLAELPRDRLSKQCQAQVLRRQRLVAQDYRVSRGMLRACRDDVQRSRCRQKTSSDKTMRLAQILLCLENAAKNGTKLDSDCQLEMLSHRRILMEDYRLSPEIVDDCGEEITKFCAAAPVDGRTIHCLMEHANLRDLFTGKKMREKCKRALEDLVKETDAGEDWRVDPVLRQACQPVVAAACRNVRGGDARVMSCLLDAIGADAMTDDCEDALVQIEYFVARDFKLDPQLYRACRDDAVHFCHASPNWHETKIQPSNAPQVLPCLYRYAYQDDSALQLKKTCLIQIKRVMRQRAITVDLQPEIFEPCLDDLALFCKDQTERGAEMSCLQKNYDDLKEKCHDAVEKFTEIESENVDLNPYVADHCRNEIATICRPSSSAKSDDTIECLIAHKNDQIIKANQPCRVSIEHFQIITLKDYRFTYKFKMACKMVAMRFCAAARTKADVVGCLSEKVTNDTVRGFRSDVPKECRQQLRAQLFQQRENIDLDPKLSAGCRSDIRRLCAPVQRGDGRVLECLRAHQPELGAECGELVFRVKKQDVGDNAIDYALVAACRGAIDAFCAHHDPTTVLECLRARRDERGFGAKCRGVVLQRMRDRDANYRLNPGLERSCAADVDKYCRASARQGAERDLNGAVIGCLKAQFRRGRLAAACEAEVVEVLREQALDVDLDPLVRVLCRRELEAECGGGGAYECLKRALLERRIATPECKVEVAGMIEEARADIKADPVLQQVCALDLIRFCKDVQHGNGKQIKCLKIILDSTPHELESKCKETLNDRFTMYESAARIALPENINDLYKQVYASPSKSYFVLVIFTMIGFIFLVGIVCGRSFRRHINVKNK